MKKLAIVLMMAVILGLSQVSRIGRVNTEMQENAQHVSGLWTIETDGDYYAYFYSTVVSGYSSGWQFTIPAYPLAYPYQNTSVSTDSVIELYDGLDLIESFPLSNWVDFVELDGPLTEFFIGYTIRVTLGTVGTIEENDGYGETETLDLGDCTAIKVKVYQSFVTIPSEEGVTWINSWETLATAWVYQLGRLVYYHSQMALYDSEFSVYGFNPPSDPTPPTDYTFNGWKTITGDYFDFDAGITDPDWLEVDEDGYDYLTLWASFVNLYDPSIELPQNPVDNSPTGFLDILDAFGLDDDGGKMIVFYVIALVAVFGLLAIKPIRENSFVIIIVLIALTALFMFLGWLPVWSSVITFLILTYAGLKTLGMTPTSSRED
jgi:hypothetical protein